MPTRIVTHAFRPKRAPRKKKAQATAINRPIGPGVLGQFPGKVPELDFGDEYLVVRVLQLQHAVSPLGKTKRYVGYLTVEEIRRFAADDDFSWLKVERPAELRTFRNGAFDEPPHEVPPIVAYSAPLDGRQQTRIGEGRGRINFARAHNMRLHVWCLGFPAGKRGQTRKRRRPRR
jgi:hypothetical protein